MDRIRTMTALMLSMCAVLILTTILSDSNTSLKLTAEVVDSPSDLDDIKGSLEDDLSNATSAQDGSEGAFSSDHASESVAIVRLLYPVIAIVVVTNVILLVGMAVHRNRSSSESDDDDDTALDIPPPPESD